MKDVYVRSITHNLQNNTVDIYCLYRTNKIGGEVLLPQVLTIPVNPTSDVSLSSIILLISTNYPIHIDKIGVVTELSADEILTLPPINAPLPFRV
jgi:hypothetical protein